MTLRRSLRLTLAYATLQKVAETILSHTNGSCSIEVIPFGSTENHGDAQPYGEDVFIVTRMCEMIAQKTGCTVAEPLWYASHPFAHLGQTGTVPIPDDLTSALVRSISSSISCSSAAG